MRPLALALALAATVPARAEEAAPGPAATAEGKPVRAWELDGFAGYGQLAFPTLDTQATWSNGGPGFALTVAYRGPHFTHPFFDVSYVPIISSGQNFYLPGSNGSAFASNSSYALGFVVGPGWDIDWFRFRVGVGLYDVVVESAVLGQTNTSSALSLGFLVSAAVLVWRPEPIFALGIEARLAALQAPTNGIYQTSWAIGLTGSWDFVHQR